MGEALLVQQVSQSSSTPQMSYYTLTSYAFSPASYVTDWRALFVTMYYFGGGYFFYGGACSYLIRDVITDYTGPSTTCYFAADSQSTVQNISLRLTLSSGTVTMNPSYQVVKAHLFILT